MPSASAPDWIVAGFTGLAAFATVGAVVVALKLDNWRERRLRPTLQLSFDPYNRRENLDLVTVGLRDGYTHWVRMRVSNEEGRRSAEDVEVFLLRCERLDERQEISPLNERPFWWSGVRNADADETRIVTTRIPPGVVRHLDLCFIVRKEERAAVSLCTMPQPIDGRNTLQPGVYAIELILAARDVDARRYKASIRFDGTWSDGEEIWNNVDVRMLSGPEGE